MKLADVCIRRPVFAIMMSVALVVLGVFSYRDLGVDLMPRTESPTVSIMVRLNGASPEEVESQITKPIEETVNSIDGIDELRTRLRPGQLEHDDHFQSRKGHQGRRSGRSRQSCPDDSAGFPATQIRQASRRQIRIPHRFLTLAIYGDRDPKELTQIVDKQIKQQIESVDGRRFGSVFR